MCGIAGVHLLDASIEVDLDAMLTTLLDSIEHRGGDATGFVAIGDEGVTEWQKAACGSKDFNRNRRRVPKGTTTILAHTRWATQGLAAFVENNHPLKRGSFYAIHNGHVSNDYKLFELAGRSRFGQVDSECIPARLASLGKLDAMPTMMTEIVGAAAVAAVNEAKPGELALARGYSSPLFVLRTKKLVLFASTPEAVRGAYKAHVGKLPKRAAIENVAEGTFLLWRNGKMKRSSFTPYKPEPVKKYATSGKWLGTNIVLPWQDVTTETQSDAALGGEGPDWLDCDACGVGSHWAEMHYKREDEGTVTWQFCHDCNADWEWQGHSFLAEMGLDDVQAANDAVLAEDDEQ